MHTESLLEVRNLKTYFFTKKGAIKAVDDISFSIETGETFGLIGESGCGKSMTALSIMRLIPQPPGKIVNGKILFENKDLLSLSDEEMRRVRGGRISMIFQDPTSALNPVLTIGDQLSETLMIHKGLSNSEAKKKAIEKLETVGVPSAEQRINEYPHQLSGGMRQRVMIAMALSCNPVLLIADEPTTNLDVTIQAQILELMNQIKKKYGGSIMLITHDFGIVAEICDKVAVMYAGEIVEYGSTISIFYDTVHPYTKGLISCIPKKGKNLKPITGNVPNLLNLPKGCRFYPRCSKSKDICSENKPSLVEVDKGHYVSCYLNGDS